MNKQQLIYKVLAGQATETEMKELDKWMASDVKNVEEFEDIQLLYEADRDFDKNHSVEVDENMPDGFRNIQERIAKVELKRKRIKRTKTAGISLLLSIIIFIVSIHQINRMRRYESASPIPGTKQPIVLEGNLAFNNASLKSICEILESSYPLRIHVENSRVLECPFTGTFYQGTPIDEIVQTLAQSGGLQISGANGSFSLSGKGCADNL